ncbi:MAG: hypothetical protein HY898_11845 [Deltaproteobacteria bacterium]|nr:hypothetical protein [Deltaproteobacteria bacterium]
MKSVPPRRIAVHVLHDDRTVDGQPCPTAAPVEHLCDIDRFATELCGVLSRFPAEKTQGKSEGSIVSPEFLCEILELVDVDEAHLAVERPLRSPVSVGSNAGARGPLLWIRAEFLDSEEIGYPLRAIEFSQDPIDEYRRCSGVWGRFGEDDEP